jgi:hypothetical protein
MQIWFIPLALLSGIGLQTGWAQLPPSQRELNGFLIGQQAEAIGASFPALFQVDTASDGWIYRTYLVDRATHSYMSFKFPPGSSLALSVQIAGGKGTPMRPFLGVQLGDSEDVLRARFGPPTRTKRLADWPATVWDYASRNYSFEVDTTGRLSSIQIYTDDGFPTEAPTEDPALDDLSTSLEFRDQDDVLEMLAPDVVLNWRGRSMHFPKGARQSLADSTSEFDKALFGPWPSLRLLLERYASTLQAERGVRLGGKQTLGYRLPGAPYPSVVFVASEGAWRVWEVDFGPETGKP